VGPTPEEAIEREERKAWEAWEREQEWKAEEREEQERKECAAREARELAVRKAQEQEAWKVREAEERAARAVRDRAIMREAHEQLGPEIHEARESEEWGPIIDAPASQNDNSATPAPENDDSETLEQPSNLFPLPTKGRKRGPMPVETWRKLMPHLETKFPKGQPSLDDARIESNTWLKSKGLTMSRNGLRDGLKWRLPYLHKNIQDWLTVDGLPNSWKD
jgi:hypothetical protein